MSQPAPPRVVRIGPTKEMIRVGARLKRAYRAAFRLAGIYGTGAMMLGLADMAEVSETSSGALRVRVLAPSELLIRDP